MPSITTLPWHRSFHAHVASISGHVPPGPVARDVDAFCAPYSEDVQILGLDGKAQTSGMEAFRARYRTAFQKMPKAHCELAKRMAVGNFVLDEEAITGTGGDPFHAIAIYEVRNGKIAVVRFIK